MREKLWKKGKEIRRKHSKFCQVNLKSCNSLCSAPLVNFSNSATMEKRKKETTAAFRYRTGCRGGGETLGWVRNGGNTLALDDGKF